MVVIDIEIIPNGYNNQELEVIFVFLVLNGCIK